MGAAIPVSPHDCLPSCRSASLETSCPLVRTDCEPHMDSTTIETYTRGAVNFAAEWANQPAPNDLYARLKAHFRQARSTSVVDPAATLRG